MAKPSVLVYTFNASSVNRDVARDALGGGVSYGKSCACSEYVGTYIHQDMDVGPYAFA